MKKIFAILLIIAIAVSLTACMGTTSNTASTTPTEKVKAEDVDIKNYEKNFSGMLSYLYDLELITGDKIETQADIVGAKSGVRYNVDKTNFVEFYAVDTDATPDQAVKMFDSIADDGTYDPLGLQKMKGVVSGSGKYVMLYKADSSFDYSKIEKEFKKF